MTKLPKKLVHITDANRTYVCIGDKYYEVHEDVHDLIKMLVKENRRRKKVKNERYEA
jgi:hypothetical protein